MTARLVRLGSVHIAPGRSLYLWCPACEDAHLISIDHPGSWTWDGNEAAPTINPSIKVTGVQWAPEYGFHKPRHHVVPGEQIICHSFVRAGRWEFLADCTHDLAGQTVPMVSIPDGMFSDDGDL